MPQYISDKSKLGALGAVSIAAYGYAVMSVLSSGAAVQAGSPAAYTHVAVKKPLTVAAFRAHVDQSSRDDLLVVVLRRNACDICPGLSAGLEEAGYRLMKKAGRGFSVLELNAEQNPEIASLIRQRDSSADARLHAFYNGEKIFESQGISADPRQLTDALEMVQALAQGRVSIYDKYQPAATFEAPEP